MPFTVSHVVAVLPLMAGRHRAALVPAALVIGSMTPDLPYFAPVPMGAGWTHSASGPVTIDLLLGLVAFALWHLVLADPLADLSPTWLRCRLPVRAPMSVRRWFWAACSVVVGATTHVFWDTFTHHDRWGTRHVAWLAGVHGGLPGFKWFQYGSGIGGMTVLVWWLIHRLSRTGPQRQQPRVVATRSRVLAWLATSVVFAGALSLTWRAGAQRIGVWLDEALAVRIATVTMSVTVAAVLVLCVGWQARRLSPGSTAEDDARGPGA